ncbi:uncharacterized protein BCR38DRAFT_193555 [Pseudomassariella vexata]|uniref:Uncharacterized protein n=1 Tax=Pseudomassariella vexata TaxID=1141098 RepID=A0A1Y2E0Z9_9PEZI|nr:uncharacterized protein BCR38DRAFT_193555 [Pseudomassariella vexata]ORY65231.1 hypothetical protein BCR38DRAFT_193555 [Pseudomassariella vexata]
MILLSYFVWQLGPAGVSRNSALCSNLVLVMISRQNPLQGLLACNSLHPCLKRLGGRLLPLFPRPHVRYVGSITKKNTRTGILPDDPVLASFCLSPPEPTPARAKHRQQDTVSDRSWRPIVNTQRIRFSWPIFQHAFTHFGAWLSPSPHPLTPLRGPVYSAS